MADLDKRRGMLLGLAVGDALGNTTESQLPNERRSRHGEITHYLPNREAAGRAVGNGAENRSPIAVALAHALESRTLSPEQRASVEPESALAQNR